MHDNKESRSYGLSDRGRCDCGDCIEFGCDCADTGRHDNCLCGRCGDGSDDVRQEEGGDFENGAGRD